MSIVPVTALLAVKNEEANIARCLAGLTRAERVIVLDSQSTDRTAEIAKAAGAEVVQFDYRGGYPKKRQWALDTLDIRTDWVLLLDADEFAPPKLWDEIAAAITIPSSFCGYFIVKGFHFLGRRFRFGGFFVRRGPSDPAWESPFRENPRRSRRWPGYGNSRADNRRWTDRSTGYPSPA